MTDRTSLKKHFCKLLFQHIEPLASELRSGTPSMAVLNKLYALFERASKDCEAEGQDALPGIEPDSLPPVHKLQRNAVWDTRHKQRIRLNLLRKLEALDKDELLQRFVDMPFDDDDYIASFPEMRNDSAKYRARKGKNDGPVRHHFCAGDDNVERRALGESVMHWDCREQGCFNVHRRPKIELFAKVLGCGAAMTDIDGYTNVLDSRGEQHLLFLEWKNHTPSDNERGTSGQWEGLRALTHKANVTTIVVYGDAQTMQIYGFRVIQDGVVSAPIEEDESLDPGAYETPHAYFERTKLHAFLEEWRRTIDEISD